MNLTTSTSGETATLEIQLQPVARPPWWKSLWRRWKTHRRAVRCREERRDWMQAGAEGWAQRDCCCDVEHPEDMLASSMQGLEEWEKKHGLGDWSR